MQSAVKWLLANWKTTFLGAGAFLGALGHMLTALANGDTSSLAHDVPIILTGLGLIMAKDSGAHP
jgi:hypothetical protein